MQNLKIFFNANGNFINKFSVTVANFRYFNDDGKSLIIFTQSNIKLNTKHLHAKERLRLINFSNRKKF